MLSLSYETFKVSNQGFCKFHVPSYNDFTNQ